MTDHANLVSKLRDIHPPTSDGVTLFIYMTILGGLFGAGIAFILTGFRKRKQSIYTAALRELNESCNHPSSDQLAIQARVLREIATSLEPSAAFLRGEAWLVNLDDIFRTNFFTQGAGRIFGEDLYRPVNCSTVRMIDSQVRLLIMRTGNV